MPGEGSARLGRHGHGHAACFETVPHRLFGGYFAKYDFRAWRSVQGVARSLFTHSACVTDSPRLADSPLAASRGRPLKPSRIRNPFEGCLLH